MHMGAMKFKQRGREEQAEADGLEVTFYYFLVSITKSTDNSYTFRKVNVLPNFWELMLHPSTPPMLSPRSRSVTNSSPKDVMSTKSTTPSVLCQRPCLTGSSNSLSKNVTKLLIPNKRDSTSLVYWILLVSKSST